MNLSVIPHRVIEHSDRRVLGAFQFVDGVTGLPLNIPAQVEVRRATLPPTVADPEVVLDERRVRILQNRSGVHVLFRAPFFDDYTVAFENPQNPAEIAARTMRLHIAAPEVGPSYLPQEFDVDLPRSLDPDAVDSVLVPQDVRLYRTPGSSVLPGWTVLRVRVTESGTDPEVVLGGVLIRVFRTPRGGADLPIGEGFSEWRNDIRGEALVAMPGVQRFRPGSGSSVIETEETIEFEVTRDSAFTGAGVQLPDVPRIAAGAGPGIIRPPAVPPGSQLQILEPASPVRVRAGREHVVHLAMS